MKKWEKKITDLEKFFQKMLVIMNPSFIKSSESNFLKKTSKLTNSKKSVNTKIITQPEKEKRMLIKSVLQKFNSNFQTPKTPK